METQPGRDIDIKIGVVHTVQPPQHRELVERDMLRVDRKIERQKPDQAFQHGAATA